MEIAIIGMGTMGPGMASRMSRGGHHIRVHDVQPSAIERAKSIQPVVDTALDGLGVIDQEGGITYCAELEEAVVGANLIIENIPENTQIKADLYLQLDKFIDSNVLVATNTSGIPISKLQEYITDPHRFIGMHWSNPPHIIPMIEVIAGSKTDPVTVTKIQDLIRSLNLLPVTLKKDVPGFVENRVLYALLRECVDLVEKDVIEPEDIDTCVSWGIGYKLAVIGPMRLLDMAGLDIYHSVASFLNSDLCARTDISPMINKVAEKGKLGMKSGGGLFEYSPEELSSLPKERGTKLVAVRKALEGKT